MQISLQHRRSNLSWLVCAVVKNSAPTRAPRNRKAHIKISNIMHFEQVEYQKALSIKVGEFLICRGFDISSCTGVVRKLIGTTPVLGILYKDPEAKPRKYLFGLIKVKPRRIFLGTVWFKGHHVHRATEQSWVFEVYGRNHIELVQTLVTDLASTFGVKITLHLSREHACVEAYVSDF